jgi:hypothetical protein
VELAQLAGRLVEVADLHLSDALLLLTLRGTERVAAVFGLHVIAYNLIRLGNAQTGLGSGMSSGLPRGVASWGDPGRNAKAERLNSGVQSR